MKSSGGGNGPGRNPPGRAGSTSAAASPSSSSSAVSASHLGFDSTQQQFYRKPEANEAFLAYQAGGLQGVVGASFSFPLPGSSQLPQQCQKLDESALQHGPTEDGPTRRQCVEQQALNAIHQGPFQFAFQSSQKSVLMPQQSQAKIDLASGKDQDAHLANMRLQEHAAGSTDRESHASSSKSISEQFSQMRPMIQSSPMGQFSLRPSQPQMMQAQQLPQNMQNNQLAVAAQMQSIQAWARDNNIDLSQPANANMMAKLIPVMQARMAAQQKGNENNLNAQSSSVQLSKPPTDSLSVTGTSLPHVNLHVEAPMQPALGKAVQTVHAGLNSGPGIIKNSNNMVMQQFAAHGRENQVSSSGKSVMVSNGMLPMHTPHQAANSNQGLDQSQQAKGPSGPESFQAQYIRQVSHIQPQPAVPSQDGMLPMRPSQQAAISGQGLDQLSQAKGQLSGPEKFQAQYLRQISQPLPQPVVPSNDGGSNNSLPSQGAAQQRFGFTKQQLHVLKAQILALRRLKKGDGTLPQELLRAIAPPPLELQLQQPQVLSPRGNVQAKSGGKLVDDGRKQLAYTDKDSQALRSLDSTKHLSSEADAEERATGSKVDMQVASTLMKEHSPAVSAGKEEQHPSVMAVKSEQNAVQKASLSNDFTVDKGKAAAPQVAAPDAGQGSNSQASTDPHARDTGAARKYHGPLFDFPFFTRKHDSFGSGVINSNNNLTLAYDVKDVLLEEGQEVLNKKRLEKMKNIGSLLAINLERKRIRPDLVLRLQIEEKKLRLMDLQARLRDEVDNEQREIMAMPDRPYRKFVRLCERQRFEMARQVQVSQKAAREKQLKSIFQWRKKLLEAHWTIRDARIARNRGVAKYHERMLREFSKRKDDGRNKRMEALKNNDVERYREMLLEQQTNIPGDAAERYAVLSTFLTQTEEYLQKLGNKIAAAKTQQEVEEAANAAATAARLQGLSEEEVRAAAACAGEEVTIRHQFGEMNAPKDGSYVNKYYNLAHAVNERVVRQPSMLRAGTLRDYQLVGLQWMLSLYNNKLNGILADEMGLGKTVQVMALIAYLMEFKGNYGPHLIIVPNAVLVNWKSEFYNWLPSVSCIFYVGGKDQRSRLFSQEVVAMKFNVLVTTYEFIMYDRAKLSKVDWKYIIIDEAQRMKDRESVLARDLDRYRCQRRLLLTGTPLQNDLKELWSLLNLLLPEVFDNRKVFHDWFSKPFQKEGPTPDAEDDWLETEKKVIIIHRLHQILEPFMLRRRVQDVEGSLPPKVSVVLKCRMSAIQSAIYDWIKSTGTLRVDPEDEKRRVQKNPSYQARIYKPLNNRCMELRKACNHPLLNYPYYSDLSKAFLVRACGKLWILDRILIKLQRTGHRVLLFSTMTKLLDIVEEYLQWRRLVYRRIDGTTSLEDRESAILDFNSPDSDCFIFLLSIRAAGRGLNLQSADTVIIYDPDPNPKNEEQAVARAHRIGQTREVKVIYMEAVVDKISCHQKEDELRSGGRVDLEDDMAGKDRYVGSIESLIRNNIQQYKIDMADEVINAGRFDQRTTHEERRLTLETLLHDEERYQETVHDVPSLQEVNRMIARSEEELELFDQMDEDLDWTEEMTDHEQVPEWLRASTREVNAALAALSKKPSKNPIFAGMESNGVDSETPKTGRKRGRPKRETNINYKELDDDIEEYSGESSDEKYSAREEDGEVEGFDDDDNDDYRGAAEQLPNTKDQSEDDVLTCEVGNEYLLAPEAARNNQMLEEGTSSGSSMESQKLRIASPVSSQKFGSLSALDARPASLSKRASDELEEGEIAVSGDSHLDRQQSGSLTRDREEVGEDEQVLQPKLKRKRSIRMRPRQTMEKPTKSIPPAQRGDSSSLAFQMDHKYQPKLRNSSEDGKFMEPDAGKQGQAAPSLKSKRQTSSRRMSDASKLHALPQSGGRSSYMLTSADAADQGSNWDGREDGGQMSDAIQRKCKNVVSKLHRRIDKEGNEVVPLLMDLWKKIESGSGSSNLLDLRKIDQHVDKMEYRGVMDLVDDVQFMLKGAVQYYSFSREVKHEALKVHDLFFDILKIAFPETDFREARSTLSFSGPASCSSSAQRHAVVGQGKRHRAVDQVQADPNPPIKQNRRGAPPATASEEGTRIRVQLPRKELGQVGGHANGRELSAQDSSLLLTHPGELVICKKKRKEREKMVMKSGSGPSIPGSPAITPRGLRSPSLSSGTRDSKVAHHQPARMQGWANPSTRPASNSSGVSGSVGWANPVKRLRSDNGRRRPSQL